MSTESREHLSAFMDGEVHRESARFLVRRLAADCGLRDTWARYHLIRDCLRRQDGEFVAHGLRDRVHGLLEGETAHADGRSRGWWLRTVAGTAIAASVAVAAVLVVTPERATVPESAGGQTAQQGTVEPFVSPNIRTRLPKSQPVNLSGTEPEESREINAYLLRHYQVAGGAGGRNFVSFVPIVVTQGIVAADANREAETIQVKESGVR